MLISRRLEGHLLALEVAEATTVGRETTTAATGISATATATASTVAKASTASTSAATASAATTTEATATATAVTTAVITGSSKVDADVASVNVLAAETVKSSLGLLDGAELNVSEALGGAGVAVGGQRDTSDLTEGAEGLADGVVGRVEGEVANEQCVARRTTLITKLFGASGTLVLVLLARLAEVNVQSTAVEVRVVESLLGSLRLISVAELDVSETRRGLAKFTGRLLKSTYPLERPDSRSVMIRQPSIVPWGAKVWDSQSSSTFQLRLPTNKFLMPSSPDASVLVFLTTGSASASALRFLEGASFSASLSLESSEPDSASESEESSEEA